MINFHSYVLKIEEVMDMMHIYFKDEGRNVQLVANNTEKGETIIKATETVTYEGVTKTATRVMETEEIEEILRIFFWRAGFEEVKVIHYGIAGTTVKDGIFDNIISVVKPEEANQYKVITKTKLNVKF